MGIEGHTVIHNRLWHGSCAIPPVPFIGYVHASCAAFLDGLSVLGIGMPAMLMALGGWGDRCTDATGVP